MVCRSVRGGKGGALKEVYLDYKRSFMERKKCPRFGLVFACVLFLWCGGEALAGEKEEFLFEDGDVVGFIGDSITQVNYSVVSYPEFLYQYYRTRYPQWELEFRNLGTGYYTAEQALKLYGGEDGIYDKALEGITKAVIMFGMNEALDGGAPEAYIQNIRALTRLLNERGIKNEDIILASPTPFDQTTSSNYLESGEIRKTVDDTLLEYTERLEVLAEELGTRYVDLHTPLLWANGRLQEENPDATLTVGDSIHPKAEGSILAGFFFLCQQGAGRDVAEVRLSKGAEAQTVSAEVTKVQWRGNEDYVSFSYQPHSLPVAITDEVLSADALFGMLEWLSRESLQIEGLDENEVYTIYMDKVPIGSFTGKELGEGVNLAGLRWNFGQVAARDIEVLNQKWQECSAKYRSVLGNATLGEREAIQEDVNAAYVIWKKKTEELKEQMTEIARTSASRVYRMEAVSQEGGLIYMRLEHWKWPLLAVALGSLTLLAGILLGIRSKRKRN